MRSSGEGRRRKLAPDTRWKVQGFVAGDCILLNADGSPKALLYESCKGDVTMMRKTEVYIRTRYVVHIIR